MTTETKITRQDVEAMLPAYVQAVVRLRYPQEAEREAATWEMSRMDQVAREAGYLFVPVRKRTGQVWPPTYKVLRDTPYALVTRLFASYIEAQGQAHRPMYWGGGESSAQVHKIQEQIEAERAEGQRLMAEIARRIQEQGYAIATTRTGAKLIRKGGAR